MGSIATSPTVGRAPRVRRGFVIALVVVTALFASVLLIRALRKPEPLEEAAHTVLSALVAGDARTLMKYVTPEEREAGGLAETTLQELLDRVFMPVFGGCKLQKTSRWEYSSDTHYIIEGELSCEGGKRMLVGADVASGDTPVCPSLALSIVTEVVAARGRQTYPGLDSALAQYKAFRDLKPVLETLRLKKVWFGYKGRALSWDEIEARYRQRAEEAVSPS